MNPTIEELEYKLIKAERKMLRIHAWYLAIVFFILGIFLFLLAPVTVCPNAFQNFSFASTIVSIVLAVVSIVYSFRTGKDSGQNIAGIREIERGIDERLRKFDSLKTEIEEVIVKHTKPITDEVGSMRKDQEVMKATLFSKLSSEHDDGEGGKAADGFLMASPTTLVGGVGMLLCALSSEKKTSIDLKQISQGIADSQMYIWGFIKAIETLNAKDFECTLQKSVLTVKKYDAKKFGNSEYWKNRMNRLVDNKLSQDYLNAIEAFIKTLAE